MDGATQDGGNTCSRRVCWVFELQTRRLSCLSSFDSTMRSSSDASMSDENGLSSRPTTKSKKGSRSVCEAGEAGVTRRMCSPRDGCRSEACDCPAPIPGVFNCV